jgi:hypothetical protein
MKILNLSFVVFTIFLSYPVKAIDPDLYNDPAEGCKGRPNSPAPPYLTGAQIGEVATTGKRATSTFVSNRFYRKDGQDEQERPPGKRPK